MTLSLRCAGLALAAAAMLAGADEGRAANNAGLDTIELRIINDTGHGGNLFLYVWGASGGTQYYVTNRNGDVATFADSSTFQAKGINLGSKKRVSVQIPKLVGARAYFSLGRKMQVTASGGNPSTPLGWTKPSATVQNPNFKTIFDWFEYSWVDVTQPSSFQSSFNGNLTQVDMVGIPMLLRLNGKSATNDTVFTAAGFAGKNARKQFIAKMKKAPNPWRKLVVNPKAKIPTRVVSPYNGMDLGGGNGLGVFPNNFLQGYINKVFAKYARAAMYAQTTGPSASFKGHVGGASLVFTDQGNSANTVTFAKPTSLMAFQGYLGTPSNSGGDLATEAAELARYLQAGFMRTTILGNGNISHCPANPNAAYYKTDPVNFYSKNVHEVAYKHQAYGFGWDDVCDQASDYTVFDPNFIQVKLLPLN